MVSEIGITPQNEKIQRILVKMKPKNLAYLRSGRKANENIDTWTSSNNRTI